MILNQKGVKDEGLAEGKIFVVLLVNDQADIIIMSIIGEGFDYLFKMVVIGGTHLPT